MQNNIAVKCNSEKEIFNVISSEYVDTTELEMCTPCGLGAFVHSICDYQKDNPEYKSGFGVIIRNGEYYGYGSMEQLQNYHAVDYKRFREALA